MIFLLQWWDMSVPWRVESIETMDGVWMKEVRREEDLDLERMDRLINWGYWEWFFRLHLFDFPCWSKCGFQRLSDKKKTVHLQKSYHFPMSKPKCSSCLRYSGELPPLWVQKQRQWQYTYVYIINVSLLSNTICQSHIIAPSNWHIPNI